jgi:hypothetical protein
MPKFVAKTPGQFFRMPGTIELSGLLEISVEAHQDGGPNLVGELALAPDMALDGEIDGDGTVARASVDFGMPGEIALEGSLTVTTSTDTGFPYTFPIIFGGANPPETDTAMPGTMDLSGLLEMEVEIGMNGQVSLVGDLSFEPLAGFPYTFPITLG